MSQVVHPFDGAGAVLSVSFPPPSAADRCATVHFKFVKTPGFLEEQKAGKMLYAGQFGNPLPIWQNLGFLRHYSLARTLTYADVCWRMLTYADV